MKKMFTLLIVVCLAGGCASGLPSVSSIPTDAHPKVKSQIRKLYWSSQMRAGACQKLFNLQIHDDIDCSPAIPWLTALLKDDSHAYLPSIFIPYTATPVWAEASMTLRAIDKATPTLVKLSLESPDKTLRDRAQYTLLEDKLAYRYEHEPKQLKQGYDWVAKTWPDLAWKLYQRSVFKNLKWSKKDHIAIINKEGRVVWTADIEELEFVKIAFKHDEIFIITEEDVNKGRKCKRKISGSQG